MKYTYLLLVVHQMINDVYENNSYIFRKKIKPTYNSIYSGDKQS
jgi:hypothetical protein